MKRLLSILVGFAIILLAAAVPTAAKAPAGKAAVKYTYAFRNVNGDTVLKKGQKFQIRYYAVASNKQKVTVKFKSSNKRVATVSGRTIKARRNGSVTITAYLYHRNKLRVKKAVRIRVGTRVNGIKITGYKNIRVGRTTRLKSTVWPKNATNKKVIWSSSNTSVFRVDKKGNITGVGEGEATVYAKAADGSGKKASALVRVSDYSADDTHWVAHRGLNTEATENTAAAFRLAGEAGFWGAECDIWETKHVVSEAEALPEKPQTVEEEQAEGSDEAEASVEAGPDAAKVSGVVRQIAELGLPFDSMTAIDKSEAVKDVYEAYKALTPDEKYAVRSGCTDKASGADVAGAGDEALLGLFEAAAAVSEYESYDLVLNHDSSYRRVFGIDERVWDMTSEETSSRIADICYLREFLEICRDYDMLPIIEFKAANDHRFTAEGIRKAIDMVEEIGGEAWLKEAHYISADADTLTAVIDEYRRRGISYGPYTDYVFSADALKNVETAHSRGFTGICVLKTQLKPPVRDKCAEYGLTVGTWSYGNNVSDDNLLYWHLLSGNYNVYMTTTDGKLFDD